MTWLGLLFMFICVAYLPKSVIAQTGLDCPIHYQTINEVVPYCGVSNWLEWNCVGAKPMDTVERKRAVCCTKGKPHDDCMKECNMTTNYDTDTTIAHLVCPFPGMTFPMTTTTATTATPSTTPHASVRSAISPTSIPTTSSTVGQTTPPPPPTTTTMLLTTPSTKAYVRTTKSETLIPTTTAMFGRTTTLPEPPTTLSTNSLQRLSVGAPTTWDPSATMFVHRGDASDGSDETCSFAMWTSIRATTKANGNKSMFNHA